MEITKAVENATNEKCGMVSSTWAPRQSCPIDCPFRDNGCYADYGNCQRHRVRLTENAEHIGATVEDIARSEARGIRSLSGDRPLRLHVSGDCSTDKAAQIVSSACKDYQKRSRQSVWAYTHSWRTVERSSWGKVSVLASCETLNDAKKAMERGYAAALVVPEKFSGVRKVGDISLVMCKHTMKKVQCRECKWCFKDSNLLKRKRVICFEPHGSGKKKVAAVVEAANDRG